MHDIEWALSPEFPHPSILEDLVLIPTPDVLPCWLNLYKVDDATREAATKALENGCGWKSIRLAIEPYKDLDVELYQQVVFRSLGTQAKTIDPSSTQILSRYLASLKIFLNEHAFLQPGHQKAILKIFENAGQSNLFKPWLICDLHISFCNSSLPFPTAKNYKLDRIVDMTKPLKGRHPIQPLPKRFDLKGSEKLLNEQMIYSQRFRLFDTWKWIQDEIERKVDPTGMRFIEANLPFMLRLGSDKKTETAAKKAMKAAALKFGIDYGSGGLILAQCFYCYQLREESLTSGNGVIHRYCSDCADLEKKFWTIWKK